MVAAAAVCLLLWSADDGDWARGGSLRPGGEFSVCLQIHLHSCISSSSSSSTSLLSPISLVLFSTLISPIEAEVSEPEN